MEPDRSRPHPEFEVGWERHPWQREPGHSGSRRQQLAARGPYLAAVPASIATATISIDPGLQAEAEDAIREMTRFDAEVGAIAQRRAAELGEDGAIELTPLASVLLRTESASSSQIEGVTAGARALALAAVNVGTGPNARLVSANVTAMRRSVALADSISVESILAAHQALLDGHSCATPGRLREQQVWIGGTALSPHTATFVPPHHTRVPAALADLIVFAHRVDLPVLVQVALAHAQFEAIHPFNDGNGRVGRTLVHAMLRHSGVTRALTVPLSAGLLSDTSGYFQALSDYTGGNLDPIVRQFIDAAFRAIRNGRVLIDDLLQIEQRWSEKLTSRGGSAARRLLPQLLNQPAVTVASAQEATGVALSAAQRAVERLEQSGILQRTSGSRRNRVWLAHDVIDALDVFAERVGRRG